MVIERLKTGIAMVLGFYQIYFMENILKFTKNLKNYLLFFPLFDIPLTLRQDY